MRNPMTVLAILGVATLADADEPGLANSGLASTDVLFSAGSDFQWDDGSAETSVGVNDTMTGTTFGWANQFTNNTGGDLVLGNIEIAFG